jgi:hypothetical protein
METNADLKLFLISKASVADPDPNPSDPYDFGPPGSGSVTQRYRSRSGSFYHEAYDVNVPLQKEISRKT